MLDTPNLPAKVQALAGAQLGRLIERVGLEDAAELVALATTEQLAQIFDEDLWRSARTGEDPRFDSGRFLLWLEVMLEAGERFVADRLAELPPDLVTLAIHRHVLVISFDDLKRELTAEDDEAEAAEKAFESCLSEEIEDYQLIWRGGDGWDEVLAALLALDRDHHRLLLDMLERCAAMSAEHIDDNGGLYAVLTSEETLETDLAAEREARRAAEGYVAPSAATAFLRLARQEAGHTPFTEHDPLTRAYFRDLGATPSKPQLGGGRADLLLAAKGPAMAEPLLIRALRDLAEHDPVTFAHRSEELAYLVNVLLAGERQDDRRLRPYEAVQLAIATVSRGLEMLEPRLKSDAVTSPSAHLAQYPCDGLFRLAYRQAVE